MENHTAHLYGNNCTRFIPPMTLWWSHEREYIHSPTFSSLLLFFCSVQSRIVRRTFLVNVVGCNVSCQCCRLYFTDHELSDIECVHTLNVSFSCSREITRSSVSGCFIVSAVSRIPDSRGYFFIATSALLISAFWLEVSSIFCLHLLFLFFLWFLFLSFSFCCLMFILFLVFFGVEFLFINVFPVSINFF